MDHLPRETRVVPSHQNISCEKQLNYSIVLPFELYEHMYRVRGESGTKTFPLLAIVKFIPTHSIPRDMLISSIRPYTSISASLPKRSQKQKA